MGFAFSSVLNGFVALDVISKSRVTIVPGGSRMAFVRGGDALGETLNGLIVFGSCQMGVCLSGRWAMRCGMRVVG